MIRDLNLRIRKSLEKEDDNLSKKFNPLNFWFFIFFFFIHFNATASEKAIEISNDKSGLQTNLDRIEGQKDLSPSKNKLSRKIISKKKIIKLSTFEKCVTSSISEAIMKVAYKKIGYEIEIHHLPGARALAMSTKGDYDGELYRNFQVGTENKSLIRIPEILFVDSVIVLSPKNKNPDIKSWEDLKSYRVGYERGFKLVEQKAKGVDLVVTNTPMQYFKMIQSGRVDVAVNSFLDALFSMEKHRINDLKVLEVPLERSNLFHYVHEKNLELVSPLSKVMHDMNVSGEFKIIYDRVIQELLVKQGASGNLFE